ISITPGRCSPNCMASPLAASMRYRRPSPPPTASVRPSGDHASAAGESSMVATGPAASLAVSPLIASRSHAAGKTVHQFLTIEVAADEHHLAGTRSAAPRPVRAAVEHHVHAVEDVAALVALDVQHALHAQDVLAVRLQQPGQPVIDLARVQRARFLDAD